MLQALDRYSCKAMRQLFFILVLAALGYFGWDYYQKHKEMSALPSTDKEVENGMPDRSTVKVPPPAPLPASEPKFVSKIAVPETAPGQKHTAPPGYLYMIGRVSVETPNGVIALVPGDLVKLLQRKKDGTIRVTNDQADFEVKEDQVTLDMEVAQIAEKRDFEMRLRRQ